MTWYLILVIFAGNGVSQSTTVYKSEAACEAAFVKVTTSLPYMTGARHACVKDVE